MLGQVISICIGQKTMNNKVLGFRSSGIHQISLFLLLAFYLIASIIEDVFICETSNEGPQKHLYQEGTVQLSGM